MAIYKTSKGYTIRWYDSEGRERQQTYKGVGRDEALRLEREKLAERDRGERPPDERHAPTFGAFALRWMEESRAEWKQSSREHYEELVRVLLTPHFDDLRLPQITEERIKQARASWLDRGLSIRRSNQALRVLKTVLTLAQRRRYLRDQPMTYVKMLTPPVTEIDPLSPEEIAAFLAACPPWWRPWFTVAFYTGARPGELIALRWADLDSPQATLRIRASRRRGRETGPKTAASVRDLDLMPPVLEALRLQRTQQAARRLKLGLGQSDYVFMGRDGGIVDLSALRQRVWDPTLTRAGLRRRNLYQTRHSFASNALAAGENPAWVQRQLGHTTPAMLFKTYAKYIPSLTRKDGSALAARLGRTGVLRASADGWATER